MIISEPDVSTASLLHFAPVVDRRFSITLELSSTLTKVSTLTTFSGALYANQYKIPDIPTVYYL